MMHMRKLVLGLVFLLTIADSCNNGVVGVQDYGSVTGRVLDATTNRPIASAIVSIGSLYTTTADPQGAFTLPRIPIGQQTIDARQPGFTTAAATVRIRKDQTTQAGYLRLVPITKPADVPTLPPPPTPTPTPSEVPTWSPPSPSGSPDESASPAASPATSAMPAAPTVAPSPAMTSSPDSGSSV